MGNFYKLCVCFFSVLYIFNGTQDNITYDLLMLIFVQFQGETRSKETTWEDNVKMYDIEIRWDSMYWGQVLGPWEDGNGLSVYVNCW